MPSLSGKTARGSVSVRHQSPTSRRSIEDPTYCRPGANGLAKMYECGIQDPSVCKVGLSASHVPTPNGWQPLLLAGSITLLTRMPHNVVAVWLSRHAGKTPLTWDEESGTQVSLGTRQLQCTPPRTKNVVLDDGTRALHPEPPSHRPFCPGGWPLHIAHTTHGGRRAWDMLENPGSSLGDHD